MTITDDEILNLVREAVVFAAPEKAGQLGDLTMNTPLYEIGVDSVGLLEAASYVEEKVGADFADDELAHIESAADIAALVRAHEAHL